QGSNLSNVVGINTTVGLVSAQWTGTNLNDIGLNVTSANLSGKNLTGTGLRGANLTSANMTSANLTNATLTGVNLTNAVGINTVTGLVSTAANTWTGTNFSGTVLN